MSDKEHEYRILAKYKKGKVLDPKDQRDINTLCSVGLARVGTCDITREDGTVCLRPTAKATRLGLGVLRVR